MDLLPADRAPAARLWASMDEPWREAFRQAWDALRTGNIAVGACASTKDGEIVHAARNRVSDGGGPPGEIFGSTLAHAEINVLARLPFRGHRDLVLTTTLQPCPQCAAAIRLGPIATVRFAGPDRYWDGCHDFGKLPACDAQKAQPARTGRVRVAGLRPRHRIGQAAGNPRSGLQALRNPARGDDDDRPQHRPPAPRRQPSVWEQQDEEQQEYHRQAGGAPGRGPDQPGRR